MKTIAIMQPYFFPYIGYWQLIRAVDTFVIYDDVNFIKQGFINKNFLLGNGIKQRITLEVVGASSNKLINQVGVGNNISKIIKTIQQNYRKAPHFESVFPYIEEILRQDENNLAYYNGYSIQLISNLLGINTNIIYSSKLNKDTTLSGISKVLNINKVLNSRNYFNAIGGFELYDKEVFKRNNIKLNFIRTLPSVYKQFNNEFIPNLSIIDVLMFNSIDKTNKMLNNFELI